MVNIFRFLFPRKKQDIKKKEENIFDDIKYKGPDADEDLFVNKAKRSISEQVNKKSKGLVELSEDLKKVEHKIEQFKIKIRKTQNSYLVDQYKKDEAKLRKEKYGLEADILALKRRL